jgi:hypothetical protein
MIHDQGDDLRFSIRESYVGERFDHVDRCVGQRQMRLANLAFLQAIPRE